MATTLSLPPNHLAFSCIACRTDGSRVATRLGPNLSDPLRRADLERRWKRLRRLRHALIAAVGSEEDYHLLLQLVNGTSCRELAAELGISHTTLWRRMLRLRSRLEQHPELRSAIGLPALND